MARPSEHADLGGVENGLDLFEVLPLLVRYRCVLAVGSAADQDLNFAQLCRHPGASAPVAGPL